MAAIQVALSLSTGSEVIGVFQTLSEGNMGQSVPDRIVPAAAGAPFPAPCRTVEAVITCPARPGGGADRALADATVIPPAVSPAAMSAPALSRRARETRW